MNISSLKDRYRSVKAGFVLQGTTLSSWCTENGFWHQNVLRAFNGTWSGERADKLIAQVERAAHGEES
jgi:hypothetical protein